MYFGYGIRHSLEEKDRQPPNPSSQAQGAGAPAAESV